MSRQRFPDGDDVRSGASAADASGGIGSIAASDVNVLRPVAIVQGDGHAASMARDDGTLQATCGQAGQQASPGACATTRPSTNYAALAFNYADVLHRLHRDAEAIVVLERIEAVLMAYRGRLGELATEAARLRKAIAGLER